MLAEAATSDTAGAFTDATMHAIISTKQVLQAGVFDEADGASMSSGKARDPFARLFVSLGLLYPDLVSTFVSPIQSTLVSGFDFRIGLSFPKVEKKYFRFPFPKQRIARDTKLG